MVQQSKDRRFHRGTIRSFLLVLLSVAVIFCGYLVYNHTILRKPVPAPVAVILSSPPLIQAKKLTQYTVKRGDTFAGILSRFGVSSAAAETCYRSLSPLGLSSLFPGDSLVLSVNNNGTLDTFSLLSRLNCRYQLATRGAEIRVERKPIIVSTYRCMIKGELTRSLSEDLFDLGAGDALVAKFADIFAWDINFFTDLRKGDRFEAIFEKKYAEGRFIGYGEIIAARYISAAKTFTAIAFADDEGQAHYYDENGKSVQKQFLKAPLRFSRISSGFTYHRRHPIHGIVRPHLGIDYAAPTGTPIVAPADGKVIFAGVKGGYGNHIILEHGGSYRTYYGHLSSYAPRIHAGSRVSQGEVIGRVGSTGWSTGPHLDYRMTINGAFVNSQTIRLPSKKGIDTSEKERFAVARGTSLRELGDRFGKTPSGYWVLEIDEGQPGQPSTMTSFTTPDTEGYDNTPGS